MVGVPAFGFERVAPHGSSQVEVITRSRFPMGKQRGGRLNRAVNFELTYSP